MANQQTTINVPKGFVTWEEVVGETIKLATSSFGIAAGFMGIVAAPVAVALLDKAVSAYKDYTAREQFKAEEQAFQRAEEKAAQTARRQAEAQAAEQAYKKAEAAAEKGNIDKAVALLGEAATEGSPEAMYALAMSLLKDGDYCCDRSKIEMALRFASDAGIDDATLQLALLLYRNATMKDKSAKAWHEHPNRAEYIRLVKKLAEKDPTKNLQAVNLYGFELVADGKYDELELLIDDVFTPSSITGFFSALMKNPGENVKLYYISTYTDLPEKEKIKRLKLCAKNNYVPAINNLALMYKNSDPDECRRLLIDAARKGSDVALSNLVAVDRERFGDEGAINRYIAAIEKKDEIGMRALARMSGLADADARDLMETYWEKGAELRITVSKPDGPDEVIGIDAFGGATAALVGTCAREASARNKVFAQFLTTRAKELGYLKPLEEGTYTVYQTLSKKKKDPVDPYANVGRNDPCPCGSGKKFKQCHGRPAN